jgi:hypothetical protein
MFHIITDNIQAYRRAVAATATAQSITRLNPHSTNIDELVNCQADEQLKLDGLMSIIGAVVKNAAAEPPHNPFSINGDVNQPSTMICNNSMMSQDENEYGSHSPPPPKSDS